MAAYDTLRAAIDNYIKANGNKEITGTILNDILNAMVTALGADTRFAGVATPSTNPGNPEGNVIYFASQAGTYSNFGSIVLPLGIHILLWNGTTWTSQTWFTVDQTPTEASQNFVTSGAVLQAIVDAVGVERLRAIGAEVTSCSFNGTTKKISFFNSANTTLFQLDATAFVIDGMVSDVTIEGGNFVIKFNTDAGKQDIEIPLTDIFNPANYYTKEQIDSSLDLINAKINAGYLYKGIAAFTTNPDTPNTKVLYLATKKGTYTNFLTDVNTPITLSKDGLWIFSYGVNGTYWTTDCVIEFDETPHFSSDNLITSKAVYNAFLRLTESFGYGKLYMGIANPYTQPDSLTGRRVFYLATTKGTYEHFFSNGDIPLVLPHNGLYLISSVTGDDDDDWYWEQVLQFDDEVISDSNNLPTSKGVYETLEAFKAEVFQLIRDIDPVIIEGNVTNEPDEEDLTSVDDKLKFRNKEYNTLWASGLGRVYLRKNWVNGVNTLTQEMISEANTIYHIQYDYDLGGESVTIPENCVLKFEGGSLSNGTIVGQNTAIISPIVKIFNTTATVSVTTVTLSGLKLSGAWRIEGLYPEYFGAIGDGTTNDTNAIQCATTLAATINLPVCFLGKSYLVNSIILPSSIHYKGLCGYSQFGNIQKTVITTSNSTVHTMFLCSSSTCKLDFGDICFNGGSRCAFIDVVIQGSCIHNCAINGFHDVFVKSLKQSTVINNRIYSIVGKCFGSSITDCYVSLNYLSGYRPSEDDTIVFSGATTSSIINNYIDYFKYVFRRGEWSTNIIADNHIEYCYRVIDAVSGRFIHNKFNNNRITHITENTIINLNEEMQNIAPASIIVGTIDSNWNLKFMYNFVNNIISGNTFDGKVDVFVFATSNALKNKFLNNIYNNESLVQISIIDGHPGNYVDIYEDKELLDEIGKSLFSSNTIEAARPQRSYYMGMSGYYNGCKAVMKEKKRSTGLFYNDVGDVLVPALGSTSFIAISNQLKDTVMLGCAYLQYKCFSSCSGNVGDTYAYIDNNWEHSIEPISLNGKTTAKFRIETGVTRAVKVFWIDANNKVLSTSNVSSTSSLTIPNDAAFLIFNIDIRTTPDKVRLYLE